LMKSKIFASALGVLFVFSAISYSRTFIQQQGPKPAKVQQPPTLDVAGQVPEVMNSSTIPVEGPVGTSTTASLTANRSDAAAANASVANLPAATLLDPAAGPQTYTATAYSLRGRTASGKPVSRGLIAADPQFLPLGTRVRVEAGSLSGEYLVADTGGAIKGRRIDIWTPTTRQALQFGRRPVKLTVLALGAKPDSRSRVRRSLSVITPATSRGKPTR
jgi:3D (Asp-Asp-Asp) domain-containing protein